MSGLRVRHGSCDCARPCAHSLRAGPAARADARRGCDLLASWLPAAKRARALAKLRLDFEVLLNQRLSVLTVRGGGEAADWSNDLMQAIWRAPGARLQRIA